MAPAARTICCHTSTGKGSNPPTTCPHTLFLSHEYLCGMSLLVTLHAREWKIKLKMRLEATEKENSSGVRGALLFSSAFLFFFMEGVFGGITGNRARWREWQRQTPCGLENMPGPEPTWAKIEDTAPLCCSFSTRLPVSLLSVCFSLLFLVCSPPYFCLSLFLFFLSPSFFPPLPLFAVSVPHQYLITLILFMKETHTCTHGISIHASLFLSASLPFLLSVFVSHIKKDKMTEMN